MRPLAELTTLFDYSDLRPIEFQTHTVWQRIDSIVDIINGNIPDYELIKHYLDNGHWQLDKPLGIKVGHPIQDSQWFAHTILEENRKAFHLVNDTPDLLIFDSLSDWRHPLYGHKKYGWKCFMGKILFEEERIEKKFNQDFEFIRLLDVKKINAGIEAIRNYFKTRNKSLKTVYVHFPVIPSYLDQKWVERAGEIKKSVSLLTRTLDSREFYSLVIPPDRVRPLTDSSHPNYSLDIWNHFYDEVYEYCSRNILEWFIERSQPGRPGGRR